MMENKKKSSLIEWAVLALYAISYIVVTVFHEPWFDEAQAWEIAKCGSYRDLLFLIPHGEGHPALWSLILSIPAKLGVPFELGLKSVAFAFSIATVYLIIFKSPFAKWVRYILPFTYFYFYQYGIISRTYCVVMFLCCLLAVWFKSKDEHPVRFSILLALLCASSAYGIVIAAGICICWCWDIWFENRNFKALLKDNRVYALLGLLIIAILLVLQILPYSSTVAVNPTRYENMGKKVLYMFFTMQGDAFISSTFPEIWSTATPIDFMSGIIATFISWIFLCVITPKKMWKYYFVPEGFFSILMIYYGFQHHSGICVLIYIAALWAIYDGEYKSAQLEMVKSRFTAQISRLIMIGLKMVPVVAIGVMLIFTAMSVQKDIIYPYAEGKEIAEFIKEHHMEDALIMAEWYTCYNKNSEEAEDEELERECTIEDFDSNFVATAVTIVPYFDKNIFYNHNDKFNHVGYVTHFIATMDENYEAYARWKEYGYPEVLVGSPRIDFVFGDELHFSDYKMVLAARNCPIWKGAVSQLSTRVYVRKDCLAKYGLD